MRIFPSTQGLTPHQPAPAIPPLAAPDAAAEALGTDTAQAPRRNRFAVSRTAGTMPVYQPRVLGASFAPDPAKPTVATGVDAKRKPAFSDLVDIINPLHHIPVVGMMYRKMTGDEISPTAQFMGGMLFGGPLGAAAAMTDIALREQTGKGAGDTMLAMVGRGPAASTAALDGIEPAAGNTIVLGKRRAAAPRMAGTQPVWNKPATAIAATTQSAQPAVTATPLPAIAATAPAATTTNAAVAAATARPADTLTAQVAIDDLLAANNAAALSALAADMGGVHTARGGMPPQPAPISGPLSAQNKFAIVLNEIGAPRA